MAELQGERRALHGGLTVICEPRMLLIGATGRNAGKTAFAREIIRRFKGKVPLVGVKVTTVRERDGKCPRGGTGCGVCSSLDGAFCLSEETDAFGEKDTQRLLAEGVDRVFWLRVMESSLEEGISRLLASIRSEAMIVCESNSLRHVLEPSLFIMVSHQAESVPKESSARVLDRADQIVISTGDAFLFDFNRLGMYGPAWTLRRPATAILLAGGRSSRMGTDKASLALGGGDTLLSRACERLRYEFDHIIVSTNTPEVHAVAGATLVPDERPGQGPLAGVAAGLKASTTDVNFVMACDIPAPDFQLVRALLRVPGNPDAALPRPPGGCAEPLFAVYRKSALPTLEKVLAEGVTSVREAAALCRVEYVPIIGAIPNLNTPEEFETYRQADI